tara:strand:+ start:1714 stop:1905 length:192 start_codon:yes stop_codon:yes gene_type:complete
MGRAIDMEANIEKQGVRLFKLEGAVEEMIQLLESIRIKVDEVSDLQKKRSEDVKKKANNKRTK